MSEKKKLSPEVQKIFDDDAERRKRFKVKPSPYYNEINEKDLPSRFDFFHHPILEKIAYFIHGVPSGKRGITTLRIFLTIDAPFIFNVFRPFFIQKFSQVI